MNLEDLRNFYVLVQESDNYLLSFDLRLKKCSSLSKKYSRISILRVTFKKILYVFVGNETPIMIKA